MRMSRFLGSRSPFPQSNNAESPLPTFQGSITARATAPFLIQDIQRKGNAASREAVQQ